MTAHAQKGQSSIEDYAYTDFLRRLPDVEGDGAERTPLRVAVVRSYTVETIEPVLRLRLLLDGYQPDVWFGGYNQYQIEVLDPGSELYSFDPDVVLMMVRIEEALPEFIDGFANRTPDEWKEAVLAAADELAGLARTAAAGLSAQVVVQNASLAGLPYFGIFDAQREDGQGRLLQLFNERLAAALDAPGCFVWDFDGFARGYGHERLHDPKMWFVSRNPYRQAAYPALTADLMRYVRSALGLVKKCVVLDLDNTLWGGVAGEDGLEGVALGDSYPGNCFKEFQRQLLRLYHRGLILAIASKNNEEDAWGIIDEHPDMILRREHFAATRINWKDKASNLRELASELNIGLDSFVFVDDNPAECELVRQQLPEVDVVMVPKRPHEIPVLVSGLPLTENIRLTDEDRKKGEMYRAQAERRVHESHFAASDLESFLASLEMTVDVAEVTAFSLPRVAQLTQKTNQMNMTTRRYTEAEIQAFSDDPDWDVYAVSAKDKFGDHGIIGVLMVQHTDGESRIDSFLLSCRVIGRGVETAMVDRAESRAKERGARRLVADFFPTPKNTPAAGFYEKSGFSHVDETRYELTLEA